METHENWSLRKTSRGLFYTVLLCLGLSLNSVWSSEMSSLSIGSADRGSELTIVEILENEPRVANFTNALKASNLWEAVEATEKATIFAPTDSALGFEGSAFLVEVVLLTPENSERLDSLIAQHWFPNQVIDIAALTQPADYINKSGACLHVAPLGSATKIGPEAFLINSLAGKNGVVYFIDRLLWQAYQPVTSCTGQ